MAAQARHAAPIRVNGCGALEVSLDDDWATKAHDKAMTMLANSLTIPQRERGYKPTQERTDRITTNVRLAAAFMVQQDHCRGSNDRLTSTEIVHAPLNSHPCTSTTQPSILDTGTGRNAVGTDQESS